MHHECRTRRKELNKVIPVRDRIHAVGGNAVEAEFLCEHAAIDGKARARQRAGTERHHIGRIVAIDESSLVAPQHLIIGKQVVRKQNGLRVLHVGKAGHDDLGVFLGQCDEGLLNIPYKLHYRDRFVADVHPHIERYLVVAAAAGVELAADFGSHFSYECRFDIGVDVFEFDSEGKLALVYLLLNLAQRSCYLFRFGLLDDTAAGQHVRIGDASRDVIRIEPPIE